MFEASKNLKNLVSTDLFGVESEQQFAGKLIAGRKRSQLEDKVLTFVIAPMAVRDWERSRQTEQGNKRTAAEHAELFGIRGPMFSMMRQVITILSYVSGAEREGGWGDVTIGNEKVNVAVAADRLVAYRNEHRDPKDVVVPLATAAGGILGDGGEARWDGLVELFESFPGGMSGLYNIARGRTPEGKVIDDGQDDGDDDGQKDGQKDGRQAVEELGAKFARRAFEEGYTLTEAVAIVRAVFERQ